MSGRRIRRVDLLELLRQNQAMRQLLDEWPAREIMMDYEKAWNERREALLNTATPQFDIDRD